MANDLVSAMADLKEKEALEIVQDRLNAGDDPLSILDDARRAMEIVGERFGLAISAATFLAFSRSMSAIIR